MVNRGQASVRRFLEHREIHHPQRRPLGRQHVQVVADLDAKRAQGFVDHVGLIGAKEHNIAIFRAGTLDDGLCYVITQELDDRRLQAFNTLRGIIDLDVGQTLGAVNTHVLGVVVDLFTGQLAALGNA